MDYDFCVINVYNKDKLHKLEDCQCIAEKVFDFDKNDAPKDVTDIKNRNNSKFLWDGVGIKQEKIIIGCNDHESLNIAKLKS